MYRQFWLKRNSNNLISLLFTAQVVGIIVFIFYTIYHNLDVVRDLFIGSTTYSQGLIIGQITASLISACFVFYGLTLLRHSRALAFEQFRRATLVTIYLVQFFIFVQVEFKALPGLLLNILLLLVISFVIRQEKRVGTAHATRN